MMTTKSIETIYNRYAGVYDFLFGKVFQSGRERAPQLLQLSPGSRLLEVGVGTGLSLPAWSKNIEITAIDLSQKMLEKAAQRVSSLGLTNVRLLKMDATALEFPDHSFNRVFAAYFISTVPDPVKVVSEMKRVCQPGGLLVFLNHFQSQNPIIGFFEKIFSPLFTRLGFRTDLNLKWLMKATGLEIGTLEKIDLFGHWKAVRCVNP